MESEESGHTQRAARGSPLHTLHPTAEASLLTSAEGPASNEVPVSKMPLGVDVKLKPPEETEFSCASQYVSDVSGTYTGVPAEQGGG